MKRGPAATGADGMTEIHTTAAIHDPRLAALGVAVVGAGRVGAELVRNLGLMGIGRIDVYEADRRAADPLRGRYQVHDGDFWDELTLARLREYDFAVCTIDDRAARVRMNQKCLVANVNLVQAWAEDARAIVAAHPFRELDDCACFECDENRGSATPMPLASLRLTVEAPDVGAASPIATASIAGALATALIARIASGSHGSVARRASLDTTTGQGTSVELRRDPDCRRCRGLERPVPIVYTRNRWTVSSCVATASPETLDQSLLLSDALEGLPGHSFRVGELVEHCGGGAIPAKFALTVVDDRVVCLDFEDQRSAATSSQARRGAATGRRPSR
jgi:molybdopterin/thiamine biosynthesis adenylyltransferase